MQSGWIGAASLTLCLLWATSVARAGNDDSILFGGQAAILGGAVTAITADGNALMYNPAGLALAKSLHTFDAQATASVVRLHEVEGLIRSTDGDGTDASVFEFVPVPTAVTYVRQLGAQTTAALGLFTVEASDYTLRTNFATEADIETEWQVAAAYESQQFSVVAGVAWQLTPRWQFGIAVVGSRLTSLESLQVGAGLRGDGLLAFGIESALVESSLFGVRAQAGVMGQLHDRIRVGLSLSSPSAHLTGSVRASSISAAAATLTDAEGDADIDQSDTETDLGAGVYAPLRLRAGIAWQLSPKLLLALDGDLQTAVDNRELDLDRSLLWNARLGAWYDVSDSVALGGSFFTDRSAERSTLEQSPTHFYGGTIGARYVLIHPVADANANPVTLSSTVALRYAYGSGAVPGSVVDINTLDVTSERSALSVHEFALYLGSTVAF